uniref:Retrotransposon gag domain-containing protein n=1 Tax=Poecilia reticulata TaxID=8081 RepID=A0A3P9MT26_POERE
MACVGKVEEFDSSSGDWESYIERVELYCDANDIEDKKISSILLSLMGAKTYNALHNLLSPAKLSSKSYEDIVDTLQKHFNPAPLVIAERFRFHKRNQMKDESISEYMAELRKLLQHCDFKTGLDVALRDRLVCGMHCSSTQKRLLSEKELDLKTALELANSMETAAKGASELQKKSLENEVH